MREIKFRVVCKDTKKVIGYEVFNAHLNDGYLYTLESEKGEDQVCHSNYSAKPMPSPTSPLSQLTRLQFTGLQDKNGVEIYEGDILKSKSNCNLVVKFKKGCFIACDPLNYNDFVFLDDYDFEVIGNIYENKELLK